MEIAVKFEKNFLVKIFLGGHGAKHLPPRPQHTSAWDEGEAGVGGMTLPFPKYGDVQ